jgi:poly(ADP-ribose) glycohydrolase
MDNKVDSELFTIGNIEYFSKKIEDVNEFKNLYFIRKFDFFYSLEKHFPKEFEDFFKVFENLRQLIIDYKTILPKDKLHILREGLEKGKIELKRKEAALIFALSFFSCIKLKKRYDTNEFCVSYLLHERDGTNFQFGRCFLNYLTIIGKWLGENNPILEETIAYVRHNIKSRDYVDRDLCQIQIFEKGSLFDGQAKYCVDFANKYIGGGALSGGCVQEEILFALEPEATVSMLFMEVMDNNDAIGIFNTIQYSNYTGYGFNFEFKESAIPEDKDKIKKHKIIAIDALPSNSYYGNYNYFQYNSKEKEEEIKRDIHKAFVGFNIISLDNDQTTEKTIATGNWGCGCFGGNHALKFFQQWVAATYAGIQRLDYYTFGVQEMKQVILKFENIKNRFKTANDLYNFILNNKWN